MTDPRCEWSKKMNKTIVELFAGIGGFSVGFNQLKAGWKTIWFNQYEPAHKQQHAFKCLTANHNVTNPDANKDICLINKADIPDHTLLVAGFPCQDFSVAKPKSQAKGLKGSKGMMWFQIYETLKVKQPPFVFLENVDRLLISNGGNDFQLILSQLNELGYGVQYAVLTASDYGCATKRKRLYIFAYHNTTKFYQQPFEIFKRLVLMDGVKLKQCLLPYDDSYILTNTQLERMKTYKDAKRIERTRPDGTKYFYSEGAMALAELESKPARTLLTSEGGLNRSSHIIYDKANNVYRFLTPNEIETIHNFPKDYTQMLPKKMRYFVIGNSVVVKMIRLIGSVINEIVENE